MSHRVILAALGIVLLILLPTPNLYAQSLELTLGDKSAKLAWGTTIGGSQAGRTEFNMSVLYNEDQNFLWDLGILVIDVAGSKTPGLQIAVGPKAYYSQADLGDVAAIGLGGELRYKFPKVNRLFFSIIGYYAPRIVTFINADDMYEVGGNFGYEIIPTADIFLGYRKVRTDFDNRGQEDLDDSFHFGMEFRF